ncbi:MAG: putative transposase [Candidatus Solibacter sp.]|nr:putative transposase [Candidatus Solibacter sp.]
MDEKSQIQALDPTAPILPLRPGLPERQTHDYKRHGATTLFAAFNILNGKVIGTCLPRHRAKKFIKFLNLLEKEVPEELDIHLILDSYSTHKSAAVQRWLKPRKRRRFHFHFTPTSSSWLNQVERWFGMMVASREFAGDSVVTARDAELVSVFIAAPRKRVAPVGSARGQVANHDAHARSHAARTA